MLRIPILFFSLIEICSLHFLLLLIPKRKGCFILSLSQYSISFSGFRPVWTMAATICTTIPPSDKVILGHYPISFFHIVINSFFQSIAEFSIVIKDSVENTHRNKNFSKLRIIFNIKIRNGNRERLYHSSVDDDV